MYDWAQSSCIQTRHFCSKYPKGLKSNCIRAYSCAFLARGKMCGKKYNKAMSRGCNNQITKWSQNQLVRNFCKLSCKKCIRKYYPYNFIYTIPSTFLFMVVKINWFLNKLYLRLTTGRRNGTEWRIYRNSSYWIRNEITAEGQRYLYCFDCKQKGLFATL